MHALKEIARCWNIEIKLLTRCSFHPWFLYLPANVEAVYVADLLLKEVFDEVSESIELSTEVIAMCERHEVLLLTTGKLCDHACSRLLLLRRLMKKSKNINKWKLLQKIVCLADLWCWQVTNVTHFDISTYKLKSLLQLLIIKQLFYIFWKIKLQFHGNFLVTENRDNSAQCGNNGSSLSHFFDKNFVKATVIK